MHTQICLVVFITYSPHTILRWTIKESKNNLKFIRKTWSFLWSHIFVAMWKWKKINLPRWVESRQSFTQLYIQRYQLWMVVGGDWRISEFHCLYAYYTSEFQRSRNLNPNFPSASCRHLVGWMDVYTSPSILAMQKVSEVTNCVEGYITLYQAFI